MRVLLISTYELGHQPIHVASPAEALRYRGHEVRCLDTAVEQWDPAILDHIDAVAISVPMHTAMRLALDVAQSVRATRPGLPICLYGLYAEVAHEHVLGTVADHVIAGEYEGALCNWVEGSTEARITHLRRQPRHVPARQLLPPLDRYAKFVDGNEQHLAAAVQASHGCASQCRHCPVPAVYRGRLRIVAADVVLQDIRQAVELGAKHITFADPDFLNGPHHSLRIIRAMHQQFPTLTFDLTTKVELILCHRQHWPEFADAGCRFVTTAIECVDDHILTILDKGHTAADAAEAVTVLRTNRIEPRPSLLPFTPWTTLDGLADLVQFAIDQDLTANIDPVHWTIRLLIPDGSLLLNRPELAPHLDKYDPDALGWRWTAAHPQVDALQIVLAALVQHDIANGQPPDRTTQLIATMIGEAAGRSLITRQSNRTATPRLTETWFCCAEPTRQQADAARLVPPQQSP